MKKNLTYLLFFICLVGVFFNSFHATFKLLKQTSSIVFNKSDLEDIEEDECEKKELNYESKLISHFENLEFKNIIQNSCLLNPLESKLVSLIKNVQGPPPKN